MEKAGRGLVLGKFMPPHNGHQYLVHFAENFVERLTVLVCSLERDPIPGAIRDAWMRELFPQSHIVHVTDDLPQEPSEHPQFWDIWRQVANDAAGEPIDFVFASEEYGLRLARELDARYIPVDPGRETIPVSGTAIRKAPLAYWSFIPECVRPYFVRRVSLIGPESTGKSRLARDLAAHFCSVHVAEFARELLNPKNGVCDSEDIALIARGQAAAEDALARHANRILICDTDPLLTCVWSEFLFGDCPIEVRRAARARRYDLTLLLDIDVPWVDDNQRFLAHRRRDFFDRCRSILEENERPFVVISGDWATRLNASIASIQQLIS